MQLANMDTACVAKVLIASAAAGIALRLLRARWAKKANPVRALTAAGQPRAKGKVGVLLVNLGTPNSASVTDVRRYLREFLMDERVIDIPFLPRWLLVQCIIAPFRSPQSAKQYAELWTSRGSPLKFHGQDVAKALQAMLGPDFVVQLAMRYQKPSVQESLTALQQERVSRIVVLPMFPQYSSACNGSVNQLVMRIVSQWQVIPSIDFISNFVEEDSFLRAWVGVAEKWIADKKYDHYLFSFHGLPESQIRKASCGDYCLTKDKDCCATLNENNQFCYRAQCFETARRIAGAFQLPPTSYTVSFQSRLGKAWIRPYTDDVLPALARQGSRRVLVLCPAFVADCLETTIEVGGEYTALWKEHGGEELQLCECLNSSELWVRCLLDLVRSRTGGPKKSE